MAGWFTRGSDCDVNQCDADASLILVPARDDTFYSLFSLALNTWWCGRRQARFAPATANSTGTIRLPLNNHKIFCDKLLVYQKIEIFLKI